MRVFMLLAALSCPLVAAPAQAAAPKLCVRAANPNQFNARAIGPHDIWIANATGDRTPLRAATSCIHIRADSTVNVHSDFQCVSQGDAVGIATLGMPGERCRVTKVTAFVAGSEAPGYR